MKKLIAVVFSIGLLSVTCFADRYVTLLHDQSMIISEGETLLLTACNFPDADGFQAGYSLSVFIEGGITNTVNFMRRPSEAKPFPLTGPLTVENNGALTFGGRIVNTTFSTTSTSAEGTPSTAVVIPTDATGPVEIILESSTDLINWNEALPGTYGSSDSNRFFRVRAVVQ